MSEAQTQPARPPRAGAPVPAKAKANGKSEPTKAATKLETETKVDTKTEAKADAKVDTKTLDGGKPAAPPPETEKKLSDSELNDHVGEINKLLSEENATLVSRTWEVGKHLVFIRDRVNDGQWNRVATEKVKDASGQTRSASWIQKSMKMFRTFPENGERAVKVGMHRIDVLYKLGTELRRKVIDEGITLDGKDIPIEKLSVVQLKDAVKEILSKLKPKTQHTAQEKAVKGFEKLVKGIDGFQEDHLQTFKKRVFEPEQQEAIVASLTRIREFVRQFSKSGDKPAAVAIQVRAAIAKK